MGLLPYPWAHFSDPRIPLIWDLKKGGGGTVWGRKVRNYSPGKPQPPCQPVLPWALNLILGRSTKEKKRPNLCCEERKTRHMVILHTIVNSILPRSDSGPCEQIGHNLRGWMWEGSGWDPGLPCQHLSPGHSNRIKQSIWNPGPITAQHQEGYSLQNPAHSKTVFKFPADCRWK